VLCSHSKSEPVRLDDRPQTLALIADTFAELEARVVTDMQTAGFEAAELIVRYKIDLRYEGQMNEVSLDWESGRLSAAAVGALRGAFERLYRQKFGAGTTHEKSALELISFRAEAVKEIPKPVIAPVFSVSEKRQADALRPIAKRRVYQHGHGWLEADIYDFDRLAPGHAYTGPAVVERQSTTVWLPAGSAAVLDVYGNIAIEPEG